MPHPEEWASAPVAQYIPNPGEQAFLEKAFYLRLLLSYPYKTPGCRPTAIFARNAIITPSPKTTPHIG
ncbi:MAG: hypothetical protein C4516_10480 [Oxalobacter sp.]|nr:MAG: hypothetical protein C4516_10480 [Oxalobacter sp.]